MRNLTLDLFVTLGNDYTHNNYAYRKVQEMGARDLLIEKLQTYQTQILKFNFVGEILVYNI